jgi:hypothetical protein
MLGLAPRLSETPSAGSRAGRQWERRRDKARLAWVHRHGAGRQEDGSRTNGSGQLLVGLVLVAVWRGHNAMAGTPVAATVQPEACGEGRAAETPRCGRVCRDGEGEVGGGSAPLLLRAGRCGPGGMAGLLLLSAARTSNGHGTARWLECNDDSTRLDSAAGDDVTRAGLAGTQHGAGATAGWRRAADIDATPPLPSP